MALQAGQAPAQTSILSQPLESAQEVKVVDIPQKKELKRKLRKIEGFKDMPKMIRYSLLFLAAALAIFITGGIIGLFLSQAIQFFWYVGAIAALGSLVCFVLWLAEVAGN